VDGLFRRGETWWARLVVPLRLQVAAGRREFVKSTGTYQLAVGKLVASVLLADWRRQLFELECGRMDDEKILRLMVGSPILTGQGFVTLGRAAQLVGLDLSDLLREAEAGQLSLGCRVPRENGISSDAKVENSVSADGEVIKASQRGAGYLVDLRTLDSNPDGGYDLPNDPPDGAYRVDLGGTVMRLYEGGGDVARAALANAKDFVELVLLERDWGHTLWGFVPDTVLRVAVASLADVQGRAHGQARTALGAGSGGKRWGICGIPAVLA